MRGNSFGYLPRAWLDQWAWPGFKKMEIKESDGSPAEDNEQWSDNNSHQAGQSYY